ncbi:MAG TPA: thioesterase family protein [Bryobacteraceae bacterium]|jgi:predicted thioesterase
MPEIPVGTVGERQIRVTPEIAISFLGDDNARVLSTPEMIRLMEWTCRNTVLPLLDPGHDTVGTHVDVYHLASAPVGTDVVFKVEVTQVDRRRLQFRVEAASDSETIGKGMHERMIVNVAKFAAKQAEKRR